jgi:chorismate synthase
MASNSLGNILRLTTFGESHGPAIGGILDGYPAGVRIDMDGIRLQMARRRPGQSAITTPRNEKDEFEILSGVFEGVSTGAPIGFIIRNKDARSGDYDELKNVFRPGHADQAYFEKFGIRDHRGGGRSSARETANWVLAGALAKQLIPDTTIRAWTDQVGTIKVDAHWSTLDLHRIDDHPTRCPDGIKASEMQALIEELRDKGDSIGGAIRCVVENAPAGIGEPIFDKVSARLAQAIFSLNAVKGLEFGEGFGAAEMKGSEHNDAWNPDGSPNSNHAGGTLGGITTGQPLMFRVAFKPTSTLKQKQMALNSDGQAIELAARGRHDPCVVPRAVPIIEALTALTLADLMLQKRSNRQ